MKKFILVVLALVAIVAIIQVWIMISSKKTESQSYTVVKKYPGFEIRNYPATTMATMTTPAKTYKQLTNGFGKLAAYIFKGNATNTSISMTSPVHMDINDSMSSMSFVMPGKYNLQNLPKPTDGDIKLQTVPPEKIAAIRFGGFASQSKLEHYATELKNELEANGIEYFGNFRYLGYNAPFELLGRRNEVIVSVR